MKRALAILLLSAAGLFAQVEGDYRSAGSGPWATAGTWERFTSGSWVTAPAAPSAADGVITIRSPHSVTVGAAANGDQIAVEAGATLAVSSGITFTVSDGAGTDLALSGTLVNSGTVSQGAATVVVASGGVYQHALNGGTIPTATWQSGSTCLISGATTATPPGGLAQAFHHFTWNTPSLTAANQLAGALTTVNGNLSVVSTGSGSLVLTATMALTLAIGGDLLVSGGTLNGTSGTASPVINVTGAAAVSGGTLLLSSSGGDTDLNVSGAFTITAGTLNLSSNSGAVTTLDLLGDFSQTGGTITETSTGSGTIRFQKAGTQSWTPGGTISNTVNFTISSGATLAPTANLTVGGGTFTVASGGTFDIAARTLSGTAAFTLASGGTLRIGSAAGITASGATGNIQTTGTRSYNGGANYVYLGSGAQATGLGFPTTLTGSMTVQSGAVLTQSASTAANTPATYTVNSGATLILGATINVTGTGTFTLASGATLRIASTAGITSSGATGNVQTTTRSFSAGASYEYNGSAAQVTGSGLPATLTGNLTAANASGVSLTAATQTVDAPGVCTVSSGGMLVLGATTVLTGTGSFVLTSGGTLEIRSADGISAAGATGNVRTTTRTYSAGGNYRYGATGAQVTGDGLPAAPTGNITVLSGAVLTPTAVAQTIDSPGTLTINSGGILVLNASATVMGTGAFTVASGGTLRIASLDGISAAGATGAILVSGTRTYSSGGNYTYLGAGTQALGDGLPLTLTGTLTIGGTATVTLPAGLVINSAGSLSVQSGATLICGTETLTGTGAFTLNSGASIRIGSAGGIAATGATGNIQVTGTRTYNGGANYTYTASGAQATGAGLPATLTGNVTFNSGAVVTQSASNTINTPGVWTVSSGATHITGTLLVSGTGTYTLASGATLRTANSGGIAATGASGAIRTTTRTYNSAANYEYNAAGAQSTGAGLPATLTGNVTLLSGAVVTQTTATHTINTPGVWTVSSGATHILGASTLVQGTGTYTLASGGTITTANTAGIASSGATGSIRTTTRTFDAGANYTYNSGTQSSGTGLPATVTGTITASGTSVLTLTSATQTVNSPGGFVVASGATLVTGASAVIDGTGSFTLSSGGGIRVASTAGLAATGATGPIRTTTRSFSTGGNYTFNATAAQATGSGLPATVNNFTASASAGITVTLTNPVTVNGTLTLTSGLVSGAFTAQGNVTVNGSGGGAASLAFTGSANQTYTRSSGTSPSGGWTVNKSSTATLTLSGTVNLGSAAIGVTDGALIQGASTALTAGVLTLSGGRYMSLNSASAGSTGTLTLAGLTVNSGAVFDYVGTGQITLSGNVTNNGVIRIDGGTRTSGTPDCAGTQVNIRSSSAGVGRNWSGSGAFIMRDVNVQDQPSSVAIAAFSSTVGTNSANWAATVGCGSATVVSGVTGAARRGRDGVWIEWSSGFERANLGYHVWRETGSGRERISPETIAGSALLAGPRAALAAGRSYAWRDERPVEGAQYWIEAVDLDGSRQWHGPLRVSGDGVPAPRRSALLSETGRASAGARRSLRRLSAEAPTDAEAIRRELAGAPGLKLRVDAEGWYRVAAADLALAGFPPGYDPARLRLHSGAREHALAWRDGGVEFYGVPQDTPWSGSRTYWLTLGAAPGLRVAAASGEAAAPTGAAFTDTVERQFRGVYFAALANGDGNSFFGPSITAAGVEVEIALPGLTASAEEAGVDAVLQGVTAGDHRVAVECNGHSLGEARFAGRENHRFIARLPQARLTDGVNACKLTAAGEGDVSLIDTLRVTYRRDLRVRGDALRFTASAPVILESAAAGTRAIDVTDPAQPRELAVSPTEGGAAVRVEGEGERVVLAFAPAAMRRPAIELNRPSEWLWAESRPDWVAIGPREFAEALAPLLTHRESQGLRAAFIDIEDVYDETRDGERSPHALRAFLERLAPRYAVLVGDASFDPRNYLGLGVPDVVPAKALDTELLKTVSDVWFGAGRIAVGRLPARTAEDAAAMAAKIVEYEQSGGEWRGRTLVVADDRDDVGEFTSIAESLAPEGSALLVNNPADRESRDALLAAWNDGLGTLVYYGHGSVATWRGGLFDSGAARALANRPRLPVVAPVTCLNGYFHDVYSDSLAESLLLAPNGGAAAVWASSGLADYTLLIPGAREFVAAVTGASETLGEAAERARAATPDPVVAATFILFGDPATRLK